MWNRAGWIVSLVCRLLLISSSTMIAPLPASSEQTASPYNAADYVKIEARGMLLFEPGQGYFISIQSGRRVPRDVRLILAMSENKVLVRQLEHLSGHTVLVKGHVVNFRNGLAIEAEDADFFIEASP